MKFREKTLFLIGGRSVQLWELYGCVCPGFLTSNGRGRLVANVVAYYHKTYPDKYTITESIIQTDFADEEKLFEAIKIEWKKFDQECKENETPHDHWY